MEVPRQIDPAPAPTNTSCQVILTQIDQSDPGWRSCCAEIQTQLGETLTVSLEDVSESQRSILSTIRHLESHIQELRHKYNMTSAIHLRLPPEILMEIFAQVQPASRKDIWLMHVCQTWRLLLTKTPEFWACMFSALTSSKGLTFNPRSTPEWLNMLFDHSAPCSLPLTIHQFSLAASDTLVRHAYHICSLHVQIASKVVVPFYTMLTHGFPRLESLRMTHVASTTSISPTMFAAFRAIDYSDLVLPLMRTLRLPPVFLTSGLSVDSLRLVEVESCACSECRQPAPAIQRITTDMISSFLQRCPSLQTLRFVGLGYISTSVTAPSPPVERVVLGSLDTLDISSYDIPGTANVLAASTSCSVMGSRASRASVSRTIRTTYPGKNDASSYRALHWSDETLPRVRTLRLPSIFLSPGFSVLSLRDVEIRSCDCYVCRDRSEKIMLDLPSFLKRCPFLDTLRLVGGGPLTLPHGSDSSDVLTALRVLHFDDHDVTEIRELISRITVSPRTTVTIDVKYGYPGASVQVALQSVPIFSMADKIVVRFCTGDFAAPFSLEAFQEEALRLVIYAGRRRPFTTLTPSRDAINHGALAGLALSSPSLSVTALELWHTPSWVSLDEYFSLLMDAIASFPRLAVLMLHLEDGIAFRPMRFFRRTRQGSPSIVCPVLHTFEVSWSIPVDCALNMFIASCARLRNALNERSVVESPLEVFSLTCAHTRHLQGPGRTGEAAVRKRLEKLFAGEVQVTTYSRRDPTGQCP